MKMKKAFCATLEVIGFGICKGFSGEIFVGKPTDGLSPIVVDLTNIGLYCELTWIPTENVKEFLKEYQVVIYNTDIKQLLPATGWKWVA